MSVQKPCDKKFSSIQRMIYSVCVWEWAGGVSGLIRFTSLLVEISSHHDVYIAMKCIHTLRQILPMWNVHGRHCGEVCPRVGSSSVFWKTTPGKGVLTGWGMMSLGCGAKNVLTFLVYFYTIDFKCGSQQHKHQAFLSDSLNCMLSCYGFYIPVV